MSIETHNELTKLAAQNAPEFKFSGPATITGVSAKYAGLLGNMQASAVALTETAGKSLTGGAAAALLIHDPIVGLAVGAGIAVHTVFSGSKKGREV